MQKALCTGSLKLGRELVGCRPSYWNGQGGGIYATILVEIASRCDPFEGHINLKDETWCPPLPDLSVAKSDEYCPNKADYSELIKKCWVHNPMMRPSFEQIKKILARMNPHKLSPVDMMMNLVSGGHFGLFSRAR
ncbi:hypothetical protein NDU88_003175 [Pleurodeles waltl]|uniref:Uncharacterized protein n=1 Tax=Pleurodeles waltl TaxID=8319 RepID=A0AAV7T4H9_PLEWA|nr:hypothetical protein NDU88_003175 [Pleurodeles waltl]